MKLEFITLAVTVFTISLLSGCSSAPTRVLMKNCQNLGDQIYSCEEIPKKEIGGRNR